MLYPVHFCLRRDDRVFLVILILPICTQFGPMVLSTDASGYSLITASLRISERILPKRLWTQQTVDAISNMMNRHNGVERANKARQGGSQFEICRSGKSTESHVLCFCKPRSPTSACWPDYPRLDAAQ